MPVLHFHFDYISPYAYLAWQRIHALADRHGVVVEPVPVLFAALLNHHGQKGPAEIPAKRVYVFKDVLRTAAVQGVNLVPPPSHPFNPLLALRLTTSVCDPGQRRALIDRLFAAVWGGGPGVSNPEVVASLAAEVGIQDAVARASTPDIKARVRRATTQAVADGVFGVPSMLVDGELFWGVDSLDHLDRYLAGNDPLSHDLLSRWARLPATAER
jgi:2-hydroxychromene-2-carboxylate isomerase